MCSLLSTLSLFSLFKMMMSTSLLCTEQWAAWSPHLQLLQHSLKCSDVQWHFEKSVILHSQQLIQLLRINTSWLWIRMALMYDSWWVLTWFSVIQCCTNETFTSHSARMIIVWEKWAYRVSCCWSTKRTELTSAATQTKVTTYTLYKMRALWAVSFKTHICTTLTLLLLLLLLLLYLSYKSQCWNIQLRKVSHTKDNDEEVEEERKRDLRRKMRGFITHFTDK
jgi:hypothetical protein